MKSSELTIGRALPGTKRRWRRDELEFLPAALEIIETPASPVGRAIGGTIILFFVLALTWATIGQVEIRSQRTHESDPTARNRRGPCDPRP